MSYIDGYAHELVGYFGPLPVYRPLEDMPGWVSETGWDGDYPCRTDQIVIGGGSGEFPGLVLARPDAAIAAYALNDSAFRLPRGLQEELQADLARAPVTRRHGWLEEDTLRFRDIITSGHLINPFFPEGGMDEETWLACSLGEFVYASLPELAPERAEALRGFERERHHVRYSNILLPPPGMPVYANGGTAFEATRRRR